MTETETAKRKGDAAKRGLEQVKQRVDRITADYADGLLSAEEYRQMKQGFDMKSLEYGAQLIEAEVQAGATNETVEQAIELLRSIDVVFAASTDEYKNDLLRAIFPEGFEIDVNTLKVRTAYINEHILSLCSKSMVYAAVEMKNGPTDNSRPVKGGQRAGFRTDLQLLNALFAA